MNRRRAAKGGIGQERLPLGLAEYVGRDNHSNETTETQKKLIMKQLEKPRISDCFGTLPIIKSIDSEETHSIARIPSA